MGAAVWVANVMEGYRIAWQRRRALGAVVLPVVAVALVVTAVLDRFGSGTPSAGWAVIAVAVSSWIVGLLAGTGAVARGLGAMAALRRALLYLPAFAAGIVVAGGGTYLGLLIVAGSGSVLLALAVLAVAGLVTARLLLAGVAWVVGDRDRVPSWGEAASFLLGGVLVPLLPAYLLQDLDDVGLVDAAVLVILLAAQVGLAARAHVSAPPERVGPVAGPKEGPPAESVGPVEGPPAESVRAKEDPPAESVGAEEGPPAELVGAEQGPGAEGLGAGARGSATEEVARVWPGVAMIAVAALVAAGLAVVGWYNSPVRTHDLAPSGPVAVAWPAGRHPVIVTDMGTWFCDDDLCKEFTDVNGGPPAMEGFGTVSIAADGTVVKTSLSGGPDKGGPFVHYARCVREGCREAWLPVRASADEKLDPFGRVEVAGAMAPDGAFWFFMAVPTKSDFRFMLIRCATLECPEPQRHTIGTTQRSPADGGRDGSRARLAVGADGRPDAAFWTGMSVLRFSCDPVSCAKPRESANEGAVADAVWMTAGDQTVAYHDGRLFQGGNLTPVSFDVAPETGGMAVAGNEVYVAAAVPDTPDRGFHLSVGEPQRWWRQTVWRCSSGTCQSLPLDLYEGEPRRELVAVAEDGRILVVRPDRIVLREAP